MAWTATAAAQPGPDAMAAARARAAAGDPAGAAAVVEAWLSRDERRLSPGDAAAVHLEAARHAAAAGQRDRASRHLDTAARLGTAFRDNLTLQARFKRELARVWERVGAFHAAKPLLEAALAAWPEADPAGAADTANALGTANLELRHPPAAVDAYRRSLALLDKGGAGAPARVTGWVNLATAALQADNHWLAADAASQAALVAGDAPPLRRAAAFAHAQVQLREPDLLGAEALLQRISDEADASEAVRGHALFLLAKTRFNRGRMPEALTAGLAAAAAYRSSLGDWHPALARTLHLLGNTYGELRDRSSAVSFFKRSAEINQRAFGVGSPQVQATAMEWAWVELQGGDTAAAGRRMASVVTALASPAQPDPRTAGLAQIMLGLLAEADGKLPDAVDRYRAGQRLIEQAPTAEADLTYSLVRLGRLLTRMGRLAEAGLPLDQAVARYERLGSAGTARMADALVARAEWRAARGDRRDSLEESRRGYALLQGGLDAAGEGGAFRRGAREALAAHARLLIGIHAADPAQDAALLAEAFEVTQDALASRTAGALRQAALRQAAGAGPLASLLRDRAAAADAVAYLSVLESAAVQRPGAEAVREAARLREARMQQAAALAALDERLGHEMPGFATYAQQRPVPLRVVQAKLATDAVAVATLATADGLVVWALTRDGVQAAVVPITEAALADLVRRVRAGVDGRGVPEGTPLPAFDLDAAQSLHRALLEPAGSLLAGKARLVFVADGALQSLPPALLVGSGPGDWVVRRFALSIMPSLGSIVVQDREQPLLSTRMFLGVGDPVLPVADVRPSVLLASRGAASLREVLAGLAPLPETRAELRRIAGLFPPESVRLVLGQDATRAGLAAADPGDYRILAFATHAVMAGELPGVPEPAIILSPSEADEAAGLLTASDVSVMRLNADLVLLSACNTAAPDGGPYAEGLSGLARAFLQAGARSLLVSHWAVDSLSTVELTTGFMSALQADTKGDKAAALQAAMVRLLDNPDIKLRHPGIWASFVLVGE